MKTSVTQGRDVLNGLRSGSKVVFCIRGEQVVKGSDNICTNFYLLKNEK